MDRFVMRHPDTAGLALVPESSIRLHKGHGWVRVSNAVAEDWVDQVDLDTYAEAPDLDAQPQPEPPAQESAPAAEPEEQ